MAVGPGGHVIATSSTGSRPRVVLWDSGTAVQVKEQQMLTVLYFKLKLLALTLYECNVRGSLFFVFVHAIPRALK
jgi:hypothetical protein